MRYYKVHVQNYKVGWNTNVTVSYRATYEAENSILIGEKVTPRTDIRSYEILSNGYITCYAPESIHIASGFHVTEGGIFHAYNDSPHYIIYNPCANNHSPINGNGYNLEPLQIEDSESKNEREEGFSIFPNPSSGEVTLIAPVSTEVLTINVFDISGKLIISFQNSNTVFNFSLPPGVYIINITGPIGINNRKLIVQ